MASRGNPNADAAFPWLQAGRSYAWHLSGDELFAGERPHWQVFSVISVDNKAARCWFYADRFETLPSEVVLTDLKNIKMHDAPFPPDGPGAITVPRGKFDLAGIREVPAR